MPDICLASISQTSHPLCLVTLNSTIGPSLITPIQSSICHSSTLLLLTSIFLLFFFQAEDGIRDHCVTGVQTCALPISSGRQGAARQCPDRSDAEERPGKLRGAVRGQWQVRRQQPRRARKDVHGGQTRRGRSEERRVGKECRSRWATYHEEKKRQAKRR